MLFRARSRSFRGAVGHEEGYIVNAYSEEGSEALGGSRRVEEIEDGGGDVGEDGDVVHWWPISMVTIQVRGSGPDGYIPKLQISLTGA